MFEARNGRRINKRLGAALLGASLALSASPAMADSGEIIMRAHCSDHLQTIGVSQGDTLIATSKMVLVNGDGNLNGKQLYDNDPNTGSVGVRINGEVRKNRVHADYSVSATIEPCKIKGDAIDAAIGHAMKAMNKQHADNPDFSVKVVFAPRLS